MSTSGTISFVVNRQRKSSYNHHDSYLSGVGSEVLAFARQIVDTENNYADIERVRELARALVEVPESGWPTTDDLKLIGDVYHEGGRNWYSYLGKTQGNPAFILDSGYVTGGEAFLKEEYDYILNLDERALIVYKDGKILANFPFAALPTDAEFFALDKTE